MCSFVKLLCVARPARWALVIAVIYGLSDEFHQSFVPGRNADLLDVITDAAGAAAGLWAARRFRAGRSRGELPGGSVI